MPETGAPLNRQVEVFPGDRKKVVDNNGAELLIDGKDDPLLVQLALAVDMLLSARAVDAQAWEAAYATLQARFNDLPQRVKSQLGGILVG